MPMQVDVCHNATIYNRRRPRYHRCCISLSAIIITCLIILNSQCSNAFPTHHVSQHKLMANRGPVSSHNSHRSAFQSPYGYLNGRRNSIESTTTHGYKSTRRISISKRSTALYLTYRKDKDEQAEEFQRSLLEATIANDIKDTLVKDEIERNTIVNQKIHEEKLELKTAAREVKEAVVNVTQSAKDLGGAVLSDEKCTKEAAKSISKSAVNLGGAFLVKGPNLVKRLVTLLATGEFR